MPASAPPPHASAPTLASRPLPERVRGLLGGILEYASDEIERTLVGTLNEFEQQLFKYAEQARSNMVQIRWLEAQRLVNEAVRRLRLTRLIIAHRPETIASADRVLVMHGGRIVQEIRPPQATAAGATAAPPTPPAVVGA